MPYLILTDSGGIQEEAPVTTEVPVLVMRDVTERPEVVTLGGAELVWTDQTKIFTEASNLILDKRIILINDWKTKPVW